MSVLAGKGRRSPIGAADKPPSPKKAPRRERLRLQGEPKGDSARKLRLPVDPVTRLAAAIASAIPLSAMFPFWLYFAAPLALVACAWIGAGVWIGLSPPQPVAGGAKDGRTYVVRETLRPAHRGPEAMQRRAAAENTDRPGGEGHMVPPARLGDGVAEMVAKSDMSPTAPQAPASNVPAPSVPVPSLLGASRLAPSPTEASPTEASPADPGPADPGPVSSNVVPAGPESAPTRASPSAPSASGVADGSTAAPSEPAVISPPDGAGTLAPQDAQPLDAPRQAKCLVKVAGRVLFQRACPVQSSDPKSVTLDLGDKMAVVTLDHGETWTATIGDRDLGKVYRDGQCWGRRKEVYICVNRP